MPSPVPGTGQNPQTTFVNAVASQTGLDPRVVNAWVVAEGAYAPGGTGSYNFLNLRPYPGDPYSGVSAGGFEQFSTVNDAITATVARIEQPFATAIAAAGRNHLTPASQISAIATSTWDKGHYTANGQVGGKLVSDFASLYGSSALGGAAQSQPLPEAGGGKSGSQTSLASQLGGIFPSWLTDPTSWILRGLEIIAGSILVILGLYLLVRQVGLASPSVPDALNPAARKANEAAAAVQAQRESRAAELHTSRVKLNQARATELRTRTRHRRRTKQEQEKEVNRAYIRGAAETSPLGG